MKKVQHILRVQNLVTLLTISSITILLYAPYRSGTFAKVKEIACDHVASTAAVVPDPWKEFSVKPIAYIFPQFYPFPENDQLWGVNFTEWDNVRRVTNNSYGLETIRPHESIGYYNGLDLATRKRQGRYLKDSGFFGAVFHHYWFSGKPVMDGVLQAMLKDGEPNIPFALSWANEPWTSTWDGRDGDGVLIPQTYGLMDQWRAHFEWLLPFFRHPQYLRSEGKLQFIVYKPTHLGQIAEEMFTAWRQWAVEAGFKGLDIIETRWQLKRERLRDYPADAMNEFMPHSSVPSGCDPSKYLTNRKIARIYHRGTLICWDATPRHPTDGKGKPLPICHPNTWMWHVVDLLRKIKSDPNPIGAENFLFVNALNEWGEGNAFEPSVQFGDGYGKAMKAALEISKERHVWKSAYINNRERENARAKARSNSTLDVCVLVNMKGEHSEDRIYRGSEMLKSLQQQNNPNWRAIIYQSDLWWHDANRKTYDSLVDTRVTVVDSPLELRNASITKDTESASTKWTIDNLEKLDKNCAKAKHVLFANGGNKYLPTAFDSIVDGAVPSDIYGLNVESRHTMRELEEQGQGNLKWNNRCERLKKKSQKLWLPSVFLDGKSRHLDLSAIFFSLPKYFKEKVTFTSINPAELVKNGWTISMAEAGSGCQVFHNPTYSTCIETGNFWLDSPKATESNCYTYDDFGNDFEPRGFNQTVFDLHGYRETPGCLRYTSFGYDNALRKA